MVDTGGAIPGSSDVPFHVGIVYEELAVAVQGEVNRVAVAHVEDFPFLTVGADFQDPTPGGLASSVVSIGIVLQKVVVLPVITNAGLLILRQAGHVSRYDVEAFAVGRDYDGVWSVFPAPIHWGNDLRGAQVAVVQHLGPAQDAVAHHIEMIESVEHPPLGRLDVELPDCAFVEILTRLGNLNGEGARSSLVRYGKPALAIKGHRYP